MNRISPVPDGLISARFDVALSKMLGISRAKAGVLIGNGEVSVIGRTADKSTKLMVTDMLSIDIEEHAAPEEPESHQMEILYEDDDVVVVDKPVGVAAHASVGWSGPTVLGSLLKRGVRITSLGAENRRGIVSRLDVGTSGVMLVCNFLSMKSSKSITQWHKVRCNRIKRRSTLQLAETEAQIFVLPSPLRESLPSLIMMCWSVFLMPPSSK